ncbi:MAG: hypothetical protein HY390_07315 [Deltaproteobacteria bacterium]|nr:hypothetical protein [Deltaproteobacteria bacterium]
MFRFYITLAQILTLSTFAYGQGKDVLNTQIIDGAWSHGTVCTVRNGELYCWGSNINGNLGQGTCHVPFAPFYHAGSDDRGRTSIQDIEAIHDAKIVPNLSGMNTVVRKVVMAGFGACAILDHTDPETLSTDSSLVLRSSVKCWGNFSSTVHDLTPRTHVLPNPKLGKTNIITDLITDLILTDFMGCVLRDNEMQCWDLARTQKNILDGVLQAIPIVLQPANDGTVLDEGITQIYGGLGGFCAVKNHKLYCAGRNDFGQLGNQTSSPCHSTNYLAPVHVALPKDKMVQHVEIDQYTHCVTTTDGHVYCSGADPLSAFGFKTNKILGDFSCSEKLSRVSDVHDVRKVALSGQTTCYLFQDQTIQCRGNNLGGQLANVSQERCVYGVSDASLVTPCSTSPLSISLREKPLKAKDLSAFNGGFCAVSVSNDVYCWGSNQEGSLGRGFLSAFEQDLKPVLFQ